MTTLHSFPVSQHCRRILALIHEAQLAIDVEHVALDRGEHLQPSYLSLNPNHKVPTLQDQDLVIHESNAILRYLANKHELTTWYPSMPRTRALVDQWLDWNQTRLGGAVVDIVFNKVFAGEQADREAIVRGEHQLEELWPVLEAGLGNRGFLVGDEPTIADLSVASNITHLAFAGIQPRDVKTRAWLERVCEIDGFKRTLPDPV